jgi:N-acetylneuraminic acid mutarotase
MEEVPVARRRAPWEATPLEEINADNHVRVASAHMYALGNRLFLFGGFEEGTKQYLSDLRQLIVDESGAATTGWSVVAPKATDVPSPAARIGYAGCLHQDKLFVLGGQSITFHKDVSSFSFALSVWSRFSEFPYGVFSHAMTGHKGRLYVFGGLDGNSGKSSGQLWSLSCTAGASWEQLPEGPPRSDCGSLCVFQEALYVFGGASQHAFHNDVHRFNLVSRRWEEVQCHGPAPSARSRHSVDIWRSFLVVYGGSAATDESFDQTVYLLDLDTRQWHTVRAESVVYAPQARRDHAACVIKDSLYVYGGKISRTAYAEASLLRLHLGLVNPKAEDAIVFSTAAAGRVFACGFSGHGALGLGKVEGSVARPAALTEIAQRRAVQIAAAGGRTGCVDATGALWEWGQGHSNVPRLVSLGGEKVTHVSCGVLHTVCVTQAGKVLYWAVGSSPQPLEALGGNERVEHVGSTSLQSFFVTKQHSLLGWNPEQPGSIQVLGEVSEPVRQLACGGDHVLLRTLSGKVYSHGSNNKSGQLGRDGEPAALEQVQGLDVVAGFIACGPAHSLVISESGALYSWGLGSSGQLGHGTRDSVARPKRVDLGDEAVVFVAGGGGLGCAHTVAVAADGVAFFAFGSNKFGQLGDGSYTDSLTPRRVSLPRLKTVATGWVHTVFVCEVDEDSKQATSTPQNLLGLFAMLPRDVRQLLLHRMHPVALSRLACCSSALRELCDDDKLWERLFYARGANKWELSQNTFKQSYVQRFGPLDRPVPARRWGVLAMRPINIIMSVLRPGMNEQRLLMVGLDAAGKTTVLCKHEAVHLLFCSFLSSNFRQAQVGRDCDHYSHDRVQRGDGAVQERRLHVLGRGRARQDSPSLAPLLSEHAGRHLCGRFQRSRAGGRSRRGAAENVARGRAARRCLARLCKQARFAKRHVGGRGHRPHGAARASKSRLVYSSIVCQFR